MQEWNRPVDELELSVRSANFLDDAEVRFLGELCQLTEQDILEMGNAGRKSVAEIRSLLQEMGLDLEMDVGDWSPPG